MGTVKHRTLAWHHDNNERLVSKVIMSTKSGSETEKLISVDEELKLFYKGAFDDFDWNKNGRIACGDLQYAMRRAGQNPRHRTWSTKLMTALQVSILRSKRNTSMLKG